jgi:hypothetical protein
MRKPGAKRQQESGEPRAKGSNLTEDELQAELMWLEQQLAADRSTRVGGIAAG